MRKIIFTLCLMIGTTVANAQNYDILTYNFNGTPANGIKIKTNMPFTNGSQMPTLIIEGYNLGAASPVGLILTYYILNDVFTRPAVSSFGAHTPSIILANEGGKVVIFIDSRDYYLRFNVRAFAKGMPAETAINFQGWTISDEALSGTATAQLQVPYKNQLAGDVYLQGGIWDKNGNVAIGTTTPGPYRLTVEGIIGARRVKVMQGTWADFVFQPDYKLPGLAEVEEYIKANKHLPDVPSAAEVEKEGLDVGEMNKKLLQKVEELTLYLIEQQKQLKVQQEQIDTLQDQNKVLLNLMKRTNL